MRYNQDLITLNRDDAVDLLKSGRVKWNEWVKDNPEANIDFSGLIINAGDTGVISFSNFHFPKGFINFSNVDFTAQDLIFDRAVFNGGQLFFFDAIINVKSVNFDSIDFGETNVSFDRTKFNCPGDITFSASIFEGYTSFHSVVFQAANACIDFSRCEFKEGVAFRNAMFKCNYVNLEETNFSNGKVDFHGAKFVLDGGKRLEVKFTKTCFDDAYLNFSQTEYIDGSFYLDFDSSIFHSNVDFRAMIGAQNIDEISFRGCMFDKSFNISNNEFNCVPDLTYTKISHHASVNALKIYVKKKLKYYFFSEVVDIGDVERVRRLRNIAEDSKDHESMIDFHIEELRAKRWRVTKGLLPLLFSYLFDFFSGFGRSERKPVFWLFVLWVFCGGYYSYQGGGYCIFSKILDGLKYSFSHLIPAFPALKDLRKQSGNSLFDESVPDLVLIVATFETLLGTMLLFFLILALRNRFKIKG